MIWHESACAGWTAAAIVLVNKPTARAFAGDPVTGNPVSSENTLQTALRRELLACPRRADRLGAPHGAV